MTDNEIKKANAYLCHIQNGRPIGRLGTVSFLSACWVRKIVPVKMLTE